MTICDGYDLASDEVGRLCAHCRHRSDRSYRWARASIRKLAGVYRQLAGLEIVSAKPTGGLDMRLEYSAQVADHYLNQTGSVKFAIRL